MADRPTWKELFPAILYWSIGGAALMGVVASIQYGLHDLLPTPGKLLIPALCGALAGSLVGAGNARLRLLVRTLLAENRAARQAYCDSLTGLPNRGLLDDRLLHAIAQARRDSRHLGVFYFDLDHFKTINDTHGHAMGDLVLRTVAQRLKTFIREGDTFARIGGDEFVILQTAPNHELNFSVLARRILDAVGEPLHNDDRVLQLSASIGVAVYPVDGEDPATLLQSADTAMYVAKSRGRNNYQFFSSEMNAAASAQVALERRLRQAVQQDELALYYQPQFDLASGRVVAVEALLRWRDQQGTEIAPAQIVKTAEASGQIYLLDRWILETAARQATVWHAAGLPALRMAVNLSGHHLRQSDFVDQLDQILARTGLPAAQMELELTEAAIMEHLQEILPVLTDLQVRGVSLALDEFGTGASSLLSLVQLPIRRIKIAPEFILDVIRNHEHEMLTETIIAMAKRLGLKVTAVGVETPEQLEFLYAHGCSEVAGRLLSPPLSAAELSQLLTGQAAAPPAVPGH